MGRAAARRARLAALLLAAARATGPACSGGGGGACPQREDSLLQVKSLRIHGTADNSGGGAEAPRRAHEGAEKIEHSLQGCFRRAPGDDPDEEYRYDDKTCVRASDFTAESPCRSGLPFFRLRLQREQSSLDCSRFCLTKGLDLSGLTVAPKSRAQECRCGATPENRVAWHRKTPPSSLLLPRGGNVSDDDPHCEVLVWKYVGPMDDGVPYALTELSVADVQYMDEIAESMETVHAEDIPNAAGLRVNTAEAQRGVGAGVHVDPSKPHGDVRVQGGVSLLSAKGLCFDSAETGVIGGDGKQLPCSTAKAWCEANGNLGSYVQKACPVSCGRCDQNGGWLSCYPSACGPGGGPWLTKVGNTVKINYYFTSVIDEARKDAWRLATKVWEDGTCIQFTESSQKPCMKVGITDYDSCSAYVGYPGDDGELGVNLGWCSDTRHVGSIAHEIGHALGMNHEQNRPDAAETYQTPEGPKGPYLTVFWQNIDQAWVPQYTPDLRSYIGSKTANYAAYDYASIMHYPAGDNFQVIDPLFRSLPGSRSSLSDGDIAQFEDMYQCRGASGPSPVAAPTLQPTPAPTPQPTPAPSPQPTQAPTSSTACKDDPNYKGQWGDTCASWARWERSGAYKCEAYKTQAPDLLTSCPAACGTCEASAPTPSPGECEDDPNYRGQWGDTCASWAGWERSGAYKCETYKTQAPDLLTSCPAACGTCDA